jgi:hypothetical protein
MIKLSINVLKIDRKRIVQKPSGKYLDLLLLDRPDDYGNDGFVVESVTKEERESGVKGAILGNWKRVGEQKPKAFPTPAPSPTSQGMEQDADIPF